MSGVFFGVCVLSCLLRDTACHELDLFVKWTMREYHMTAGTQLWFLFFVYRSPFPRPVAGFVVPVCTNSSRLKANKSSHTRTIHI